MIEAITLAPKFYESLLDIHTDPIQYGDPSGSIVSEYCSQKYKVGFSVYVCGTGSMTGSSDRQREQANR